MRAHVDDPAQARRALASTAAVLLVVYALVVAWIVLAAAVDPPALRAELTADGAGIVVRGAIDTADHRDALLEAFGDATGAAVILNDVEIDADAAAPGPIPQAADRLARGLLTASG